MTGHLFATALLMGLAGAPHCLAMCGAGCGAVARGCGARSRPTRSLMVLLLGRTLSYAAAGAIAASGSDALRTLAQSVLWLRPLWSMLLVGALVFGLALLVMGRQPQWVDHLALVFQRRANQWFAGIRSPVPAAFRLFLAGLLWIGLPCGLLYSSLVVAGLASSASEGAFVMVCFSLGGGVALLGGDALWREFRRAKPALAACVPVLGPDWPIRLSGLMLFLASAWALGHGLWQPFLAWCGLA